MTDSFLVSFDVKTALPFLSLLALLTTSTLLPGTALAAQPATAT